MAITVKDLMKKLIESPQHLEVYFEDMEGLKEPVHSVKVRKVREYKNNKLASGFY